MISDKEILCYGRDFVYENSKLLCKGDEYFEFAVFVLQLGFTNVCLIFQIQCHLSINSQIFKHAIKHCIELAAEVRLFNCVPE